MRLQEIIDQVNTGNREVIQESARKWAISFFTGTTSWNRNTQLKVKTDLKRINSKTSPNNAKYFRKAAVESIQFLSNMDPETGSELVLLLESEDGV